MEKILVDVQEIWIPCSADEGQAMRDGKPLKLAAIVANGHPLFLGQDVVLEKSQVADLQYQHMLKKFHEN